MDPCSVRMPARTASAGFSPVLTTTGSLPIVCRVHSVAICSGVRPGIPRQAVQRHKFAIAIGDPSHSRPTQATPTMPPKGRLNSYPARISFTGVDRFSARGSKSSTDSTSAQCTQDAAAAPDAPRNLQLHRLAGLAQPGKQRRYRFARLKVDRPFLGLHDNIRPETSVKRVKDVVRRARR